MKLFQQLLVAPAALGLLSPVVVQASELDIDGINKYATDEQVTSINQFPDVKPTDWAYQALSNLIERYGCVAGYPDGTFRGGQPLSRYEAAALLNACLDRITEITDELKRLMAEFEKELAIIRGRVDGLEAKVGELEATQFSTTTKLKGQATFVIGANSYSGDALVGARAATLLGFTNGLAPVPGVNTGPFLPFSALNPNPAAASGIPGVPLFRIPGPGRITGNTVTPLALSVPPGTPGSTPAFLPGTVFPPIIASNTWADLAARNQGATTFNYDLRIDLDTSFTGKDLFRTRLRAGNFGNSAFGGGPVVGLSAMEVAFEDPAAADSVSINRLFYQFPLGKNWTATIGGRVRQDDMLAMWPSAYPADTILDIFTYAGAPGTYSLNLGSGGGLWWKAGNWSISANYVSANGDNSNPNTNDPFCGGIGTDCSASTGTVQLGYAANNWGFAAAYTNSQNGIGLYSGNGTPLANAFSALADNTNSVGLSAYWQPTNPGWIPSISLGWGINKNTFDRGLTDIFTGSAASFTANTLVTNQSISTATTQSWYVGLQWDDVFIRGNSLGMAVGQATMLTGITSSADPSFSAFSPAQQAIADGNYAWEWWYKFQVTDNISVTPALYYLSNPVGQLSKNVGAVNANVGRDFNNFGGMIKTTFKF